MKQFIIKSLFYFLPFCALYGGYKILNQHTSGDIGQLGQIPFGYKYVSFLEQNYLPDNLTIDTIPVCYDRLQVANASKIFTIGDSFGDQGIFGYQNYLAHSLGEKVTSIKVNDWPAVAAASLLRSGIIDSSVCRIVIVENGDRYAIEGLCNIDFEKQYEVAKISTNKNLNRQNVSKKTDLFRLCSSIRLQFGYNSPIMKFDLKQDCFTHDRYSKTMFFYKEDLRFKYLTPADIEKAKANLILLNEKFAEKGIKLIYLIPTDKYDAYRPFATDNSLPLDAASDDLINAPGVCVINTKPMIQEMIRNGEKDVYMVNDTHWSYKGSKAAAQIIAHKIDSLGVLKAI